MLYDCSDRPAPQRNGRAGTVVKGGHEKDWTSMPSAKEERILGRRPADATVTGLAAVHG